MANKLNNVDMVVAITQNAINAQLLSLHQLAKLNPEKANFPIKADWKTGAGTLTADLGAPEVNFYPSDDKHQAVSFMLPMTNGQLQSADGKVSVEIKDWVVAIDIDLGLSALATADRQKAAASGAISEALEKQLVGFDDADFKVDALILDFASNDFTCIDAKTSKTPGLTAEAAKVLVSVLVKFFKSDYEGPFVLAVSAVSNDPAKTSKGVAATLVPTGVSYTVFPNNAAYIPAGPANGISTLNILTSTGGHGAPPVSAGVFTAPFVTDNQSSGKLILSRASLLDNFVLMRLGNSLRSRFTGGPGRSLALYGDVSLDTRKNGSITIKSNSYVSMTATLSPDKARIDFAGYISAKVELTETVIWSATWKTDQRAIISGHAEIAATQDSHGLAITMAPFTFGKPHRIKHDEKNEGAKVDGAFTLSLMDKVVHSIFDGIIDDKRKATAHLLTAGVASIPKIFVPPTGAGYSLTPQSFNENGDLECLLNIETG